MIAMTYFHFCFHFDYLLIVLIIVFVLVTLNVTKAACIFDFIFMWSQVSLEYHGIW